MKQVPLAIPLYDKKPIEFGSAVYSLNRNDHLLIEKKLTTLLKDLEDFTSQSLRDPSTLRALGLPQDLSPEPTPLGLHIPFARFDCLWDGKELFVLELNTDGTSGWNLVQWLNAKAGVSQLNDPNFELSERLLEGLCAHSPNASQIVLCDEREVKTIWEQKDLIDRWNKNQKGERQLSGFLADPGTRTWKEGALVYRRMVSWVMRAKAEQCRPFLEDWKSNKIVVVGGWSSDVAHSKVWPVLFQTPLAPKTLLVDENAVSLATEEREKYLLKAALSNAGKGVLVGQDFSDGQWKSGLQTALTETKQGRSWVLQERKPIPRWKVDGKDLGVELGVYFINGKWAGYLVRAGEQSHISDAAKDLTYPIQFS